MIDLQNETVLLLREAAKRLPVRPHTSTLHRWARGLKDGRRLETVKMGGKVFTSVEACVRFASPSGGEPSLVNWKSSVRHISNLDIIDHELEKEGL